ncbi:hypothetical protein PR003_g8947 [Phytophthora rubi]|uniref:Uncharacterized protein n=1 Tax=Phytophthora rubi TaxID=129364 RepID=A0A6A3MKK4_9STRA|nr:hypothetical protein PR002_g8726 [Phytophthora rubi]KAE9038302.1 hypothetical protein PR001_g8004 [Phytophthora rubi]KAE9343491.1 hypothetical protein PR003_g8947 [Phytophthora rubi]
MGLSWIRRHLTTATKFYVSKLRLYKVFEENGVKSKNRSAVLKQLRKFYRESKLNHLVDAYRARVALDSVTDQAPRQTQELFTRK